MELTIVVFMVCSWAFDRRRHAAARRRGRPRSLPGSPVRRALRRGGSDAVAVAYGVAALAHIYGGEEKKTFFLPLAPCASAAMVRRHMRWRRRRIRRAEAPARREIPAMIMAGRDTAQLRGGGGRKPKIQSILGGEKVNLFSTFCSSMHVRAQRAWHGRPRGRRAP